MHTDAVLVKTQPVSNESFMQQSTVDSASYSDGTMVKSILVVKLCLDPSGLAASTGVSSWVVPSYMFRIQDNRLY